MTVLRCTDPECGCEFPVRSQLAEGDDCLECGAPTELVNPYDDETSEEPAAPANKALPQARIAYARDRARQLLADRGITEPPVPVRELAEDLGFEIVERRSLGSLRGRLLDKRIELAASDSEAVKRFTVAHEIGHDVLGTEHGDGPNAETEANAFAGELLVSGPQLLAVLKTTHATRELARVFAVSSSVVRIAAENHRKGDLLS